ncbi:MAG: hypothetical protein US42_C0016G0023 [Candidatus Magasanikbacteria bacterium GW2011_GWC2_37_14]|uniref:Uncharacterized protein n=1 Tax=Candidatus Magasanikbacteria bacterium GW2011_GWC2_37_14 TaxID=1619046 RepID=A0A0G0G7D8_9BACT|nr:MAG: hypothetical protein US42_C0016G0023 [Candidatus Magasanikbacteria bacterium GW2011_GWC2_37_14]
MPLPSADEIKSDQQKAQEKLKRLKTSYEQFLGEWGEIAKEEEELIKQLRTYVDTSKIHNLLHTINNFKDN